MTNFTVVSDDGASRRQNARSRTLKTALVVYQNGACSAQCRITDMSATGACLQFDDFLELPMTFELTSQGTTRQCDVRWRKGVRIGVVFREAMASAKTELKPGA
jgi:hypothetical protein